MKHVFLFAMVLAAPFLAAESGIDAWLRYAPVADDALPRYASLPASAVVLGNSVVLTTAQKELIRGLRGMLARTVRADTALPAESAMVLGTLRQLRAIEPSFTVEAELPPDGFWLVSRQLHRQPCLIVAAENDRGVLYGVFALLAKIARREDVNHLDETQRPFAPIRWVNQWDNVNGSIERGYGGGSIFFENGAVRSDLSRAAEFARLLASVGINGCTINNVNANPTLLDPGFIPQLARIAEAFRPWGVRFAVAIDLSSPKVIGGLDTFDPVDPRVAAWWQAKFDEIYRQIPDFAGVVVKADSEGRLGPAEYGRTPADGANVVARALKPHGGLVFYRAFVYNHHLDWRNPKNDRARAAYDIFHPLDGKFDDNVVIQIKYGPIDFQVREPVSPLFGGLEQTNQAIELQIAQEYTGQQRHLCFWVPMWKEVLDFDLRVNGRATPVKNIVSGRSFHRPTGGFVGVSNVGMDANWLGSQLAMANLYGFGRLAWNPDLSAGSISGEWTRLTFGNDPLVVETVSHLLLVSWRTYESYTGVFGLQTLTDILGSHYGPAPESQERNGWGQWIRAEHDAVGMDRTVSTGTGFVGQYPPEVQNQYELAANTPDDLLLFFHHLPYTYTLHSGKTVIQSIYDSHYAGAEQAQNFVRQWKNLNRHIDDQRYAEVLSQLDYQAGHAIVWRDAINDWFHQLSGIADTENRVGHHPGRIEAEAMQLKGYVPLEVTPWESASGGRAVECPPPASSCAATFQFHGAPGWYELDIQYFDQRLGVSRYRVLIGDQLVDEWSADLRLPAIIPNGDSSTRRRIPGVALRPGDQITIEGIPDRGERAVVDYVEIRTSADEAIKGRE